MVEAIEALHRAPAVRLLGGQHVGQTAGAHHDERAVERTDPRKLLELGHRIVRGDRSEPVDVEPARSGRLGEAVQPWHRGVLQPLDVLCPGEGGRRGQGVHGLPGELERRAVQLGQPPSAARSPAAAGDGR